MPNLRIATWNINSIRIRIELVTRLAAERQPDILCLQEIKTKNEGFPRDLLTELGYRYQAVHGMKAYHGVAILSKLPLVDVATMDWCERSDCRHIFARLEDGTELHNFYIPAGGDIPDPELNDKFAHKLRFIEDLTSWWAEQKNPDARRVMVGDLNVAPLETDVWSHKQLLKVVSHTPAEVERFGRMQAAHDWVDAVRHFVPPERKLYSWWSYRNRDWAASDRGRRLDHIWVTPALVPALAGSEILRSARSWPLPSDHVPVIVDLSL